MKGTARKITPGTRVATVTGIQTCWARRSIVSISSRWTSRRIAARLLGDEPAEVAGLAVEGEHAHEAVEGVDVDDRGPLAQGLDLGEALADAAGDAPEVPAAGARAPAAPAAVSAAPSE